MNRAASAVLVGAALLAGCSPSGEPAVDSIAVVRTGSELRLPLDEYLLSDRQTQLIVRAQNISVRRCMRRFGFDWPPVLPPRRAAPVPIDNARRYFVIDEEVARTSGYHPPAEYESPAVRQESEAPPPADVFRVWTGRGPRRYSGHTVPRQGCAGEASRALADGPTNDSVDAQQLQLDTLARTRRDGRVLAVNLRWRACMADAGYSFADPRAANDDRRWQQTRIPSAVEVATAVADVKCKQRTNLPGVMLAVESAYQRIVIAERGGELAQLKNRTAILVAAAARISSDSARDETGQPPAGPSGPADPRLPW